jgi:hypothetical protein
LLIGDKIWRDVAPIELHAFGVFPFEPQALAFLDRDHSVRADSVHRIGQQASDLRVVGGDCRDLLDVPPTFDGRGEAPRVSTSTCHPPATSAVFVAACLSSWAPMFWKGLCNSISLATSCHHA